jgi:hypothetical protein
VRKPNVKKPIDQVVQGRLDALERLIDKEYRGLPSVFQDRTGIKMSQISSWFSGERALRDNALRRLEDLTGKELGYFDQRQQQPSREWPFPTIPVERFLALPERQQGYIEHALDDLIEKCEAIVNPSDERGLRRQIVSSTNPEQDKTKSNPDNP